MSDYLIKLRCTYYFTDGSTYYVDESCLRINWDDVPTTFFYFDLFYYKLREEYSFEKIGEIYMVEFTFIKPPETENLLHINLTRLSLEMHRNIKRVILPTIFDRLSICYGYDETIIDNYQNFDIIKLT